MQIKLRSKIVIVAMVAGLCLMSYSLEVIPASAAPPVKEGALEGLTQNWDQAMPAATRFVLLLDFANAAVRDNETGLVWEQAPDTTAYLWTDALIHCANKTVGSRKGWRLPSIFELASLIDPTVVSPGPTLPVGHPFSNIQSSSAKGYWSATTMAANAALAWHAFFDNGLLTGNGKLVTDFVWCVRGPMNADAY